MVWGSHTTGCIPFLFLKDTPVKRFPSRMASLRLVMLASPGSGPDRLALDRYNP